MKSFFEASITLSLIALISLCVRCVALNTAADWRKDIKALRYFYLKAATSCADAKVSACRAIQPPATSHDVIGHLASPKLNPYYYSTQLSFVIRRYIQIL